MSPTTTESIPTSDTIWKMAASYYNAALIKAGLELDVWTRVQDGEYSAQEMARKEGWDPIGTERLLDALCALNLLKHGQTGYHLVPVSEWFLVPDRPTYVGAAWLKDIAWEQRGKLADAIRQGRRPLVADYTDEENASLWVGYFANDLAAPRRCLTDLGLWEAVGVKPCEGLRILDVACGSGRKSLALAQGHPGVQVTLLDRPAVLKLAWEIAQGLGLASQVTLLPGDIRTVDFGAAQYQVVWFGAITHHFGVTDLVALLEKACRALVSGGMVVINTAIGAESEQERDLLLTAMEMYVISREGGVYTEAQYRDFLEQAGLVQVERAGANLIKASKPGA